MFETLENRRMLSVTVSDGCLTVDGANNQFVPDIIAVKEDVFDTKFIVVQNIGFIAVPKIVQAAGITDIKINGYGGDDILWADASTFQTPVTINGGDGNDVMWGGRESDCFIGGADNDTVLYADDAHNDIDFRNDPEDRGVTVTLDDVANDGFQNTPFPVNHENDNVTTTVENVVGTQFQDVLVGDDECNVLIGLGSNDTIYGNDGDDYIVGDFDVINLPVEVLALIQHNFGDVGANELHGDGGDDTFFAVNCKKDLIDGGEGRNGAFIDARPQGDSGYVAKETISDIQDIVPVFGDSVDSQL